MWSLPCIVYYTVHINAYYCYIIVRQLLPVQLNIDDHNPEFCRDNYYRLVRTVNESFANATCPVSPDDFRGAPPLVIISVDDILMH